ncbi:conserved exported hypothetical protein [Gammaproteobacteria bacterium]
MIITMQSIRNVARLGLIGSLLIFGISHGAAQAADVGIVNQFAGDVTYHSGNAEPTQAQAFMRVRDGDQFSIGAGGLLRLVYFQGGRQETWKGLASFRVGAALSEQDSGSKPEVTILPTGVPQKLGRMPELLQNVRLGGVALRSVKLPLSIDKKTEVTEGKTKLSEAKAIYRKLRASATPDDITPELYLFSILHDYSRYAEMKSVARNMRKRQPNSIESKVLMAWAEKHAAPSHK